MPGTSPHEPAYRAPENRSLEAQVIDRLLEHLAGEPLVSPATRDALAALLPETAAARHQILAAVRDAAPMPSAEAGGDAAR